MKMKNAALAFLILGLALTGCGKDKSNPLREYDASVQPQNTVPYNGQKPEHQEEVRNPFKVDIIGENEVNFANFIEGEENTIKFKLRVFDKDIKEPVLVPLNLPQGAQFGRIRGEEETWGLRWTPPRGIIGLNRSYIALPFQIEARVVRTDDIRWKNKVYLVPAIQIFVLKTGKIPLITKVNTPASVGEGQFVLFSVDVKDPGAYELAPPRIQHYSYQPGTNKEEFTIDGYNYVVGDSSKAQAEALKNGEWRFHFLFDTRNVNIPPAVDSRGNRKSEVKACFNLKAQSPSGNTSPEKPACINIRYSAEAVTAPAKPAKAPKIPAAAATTSVVSPAKKTDDAAAKLSEPAAAAGSTAVKTPEGAAVPIGASQAPIKSSMKGSGQSSGTATETGSSPGANSSSTQRSPQNPPAKGAVDKAPAKRPNGSGSTNSPGEKKTTAPIKKTASNQGGLK
jgi:hypothetical protein